jgi:hypothetical protein
MASKLNSVSKFGSITILINVKTLIEHPTGTNFDNHGNLHLCVEAIECTKKHNSTSCPFSRYNSKSEME